MSNTLKTTLLLGLLTGIIMWIGQYLGGSHGLMIAFVFATLMNFGSYWFSDKLVLAMYRAQPVDANCGTGPLSNRPQPGHARQHPDAETVRDPLGRSERFRHRA